jgi:hypothetical protein
MNRPTNKSDRQMNALSPAFESALIRATNFPESNCDEAHLKDSHRALSGEDDLVSSLSNAYENRRARQVFEWEITRRRAAESNARHISIA